MAVDRRRLLAEITALTDRIWEQARSKFANLVKGETPSGFDERKTRERLGKALERHFESAAHDATEHARGDLISRLAKHEAQASVLLAQVRQAAADLMEMSVNLPPPEHAFELAHEAYWVAPAPANSIIDASAFALIRVMPGALRERRLRRQIASDTDRAALRNVANLDWALRQNIEDAFRRFELSLAEQLSEAIEETRQVMQIALAKRSARSAEVATLVAQVEQSIAALSAALDGLESAEVQCGD